MGQGVLRDGVACVEYSTSYMFPLLCYTDMDLLLPLAVIHCVGEEILYDLSDPILISPDIYRMRVIEFYPNVLLLCQHGCAGQIPPDKLRQIEPFHLRVGAAEFQFVQGEQLGDDGVHLGGFIHDHLTVESP